MPFISFTKQNQSIICHVCVNLHNSKISRDLIKYKPIYIVFFEAGNALQRISVFLISYCLHTEISANVSWFRKFPPFCNTNLFYYKNYLGSSYSWDSVFRNTTGLWLNPKATGNLSHWLFAQFNSKTFILNSVPAYCICQISAFNDIEMLNSLQLQWQRIPIKPWFWKGEGWHS